MKRHLIIYTQFTSIEGVTIEREEGRVCAGGLGGGLAISLNAAGRVWLLRSKKKTLAISDIDEEVVAVDNYASTKT